MIPLGALTLLGGAAGMGKTTLAISLAAILSKGGVWSTGETAERGSALVLERPRTIWPAPVTPRLIAAGADLNRIGLGKATDLSQSLEPCHPLRPPPAGHPSAGPLSKTQCWNVSFEIPLIAR